MEFSNSKEFKLAFKLDLVINNIQPKAFKMQFKTITKKF